jgi:hypothetical protein
MPLNYRVPSNPILYVPKIENLGLKTIVPNLKYLV